MRRWWFGSLRLFPFFLKALFASIGAALGASDHISYILSRKFLLRSIHR